MKLPPSQSQTDKVIGIYCKELDDLFGYTKAKQIEDCHKREEKRRLKARRQEGVLAGMKSALMDIGVEDVHISLSPERTGRDIWVTGGEEKDILQILEIAAGYLPYTFYGNIESNNKRVSFSRPETEESGGSE